MSLFTWYRIGMGVDDSIVTEQLEKILTYRSGDTVVVPPKHIANRISCNAGVLYLMLYRATHKSGEGLIVSTCTQLECSAGRRWRVRGGVAELLQRYVGDVTQQWWYGIGDKASKEYVLYLTANVQHYIGMHEWDIYSNDYTRPRYMTVEL